MLADPATQALIAADGWFVIITGGLGLACGALGLVLEPPSQLAVLLGLAGGGVLGLVHTLWWWPTFTLGVVDGGGLGRARRHLRRRAAAR